MKTMKIGITALAAIVISGAIFYSCNKEEKSTTPVIKQENKTLKDVSAGDYFTYSNNPICLGDEVTITFDNGQGSDCGESQMQMWGPSDGDWQQVVGPTTPTGGLITYTFTPTELGDYQFRGQWNRTGNPADCSGDNTGWQEADPVLSVEDCSECGNWQVETAFGGESAGDGSAWWFYYDTNVGGIQTIWAGQTIDVGTVEYDGTYIYITLTGGWELDTGDETVKIQGYNNLPSERPIGGHFAYKGTDLTVAVDPYTYYVIQLDVRHCND